MAGYEIEATHENRYDHLWPTVPNPGRAWMADAKCANMDVTANRDPFDLAGMEHKPQRALFACRGCPVMRQCAQSSLHVRKDQGVVRAGTWMPHHTEGVDKMAHAINRLATIAGVDTRQVAA